MKIVHMSSVHYPYDTRIFVKECGSLVARGFETVLVAAHGRDEKAENGVVIRGAGIPKPTTLRQRWFSTVPKVFWAALRERGDIYHFHDPELIPAGLFMRAIGKKVLYDVHEHLPAAIRTKHYIPAIVRVPLAGMLAGLETLAGWLLSGIVATSSQIAERFPAARTVLVDNYALKTEFLVARDRIPYSKRSYWIAYVGVISQGRGAVQLLDAMALLEKEYDVRLQLGGNFSPETFEKDLRAHSLWRRVDYHGFIDRTQMAELFAQCRAGAVVYQPTPNNIATSANKVFELMAAGLPVIASDFQTRVKVIDAERCGLTVDPTSPDAIAEGLRATFANSAEAEEQGRRGAAAVDNYYNWSTQMENLIGLYRRVAGSSWREPEARRQLNE